MGSLRQVKCRPASTADPQEGEQALEGGGVILPNSLRRLLPHRPWSSGVQARAPHQLLDSGRSAKLNSYLDDHLQNTNTPACPVTSLQRVCLSSRMKHCIGHHGVKSWHESKDSTSCRQLHAAHRFLSVQGNFHVRRSCERHQLVA